MLYLGAQPGTTASMHGGQWEAAVEGTQNFADFSDNGDLAQDSDDYSYQHLDGLDEFRSQQQVMQAQQSQTPRPEGKWAALGHASSAATSVAMRRSVSKSSAGSFKSRTIRASAHKSRPRVQTSLSASIYNSTPSATAVYDMANAAYSPAAVQAYYNSNAAAAAVNGINPDQYLALYSQGPLSIPYNTGLAQQQPLHVDPTCTQMNLDGFDLESLNGLDNNMVFEASPTPISPQTWGSSSSRRSSPDRGEDTWSLPMAASPAESHDSTTSLSFVAQVEAAGGRKRTSSNVHSSIAGDDASTSGSSRRQSEGESARDHPLYKSAACAPDGLYHCPWEGDENCNHKPEKLKCNYEYVPQRLPPNQFNQLQTLTIASSKFVDSHLKPYRCKNSACENARFSSTACLLRHEREAHAMHGHGDKPYLCPHPECDRAHPGFGFPRQWNLKDHMRRVHHDDGSQLERMAAAAAAAVDGAAAPMAVSSSQSVSKGRKRKKDTATGTTSSSSSSRKSSSSKGSSDAESRRRAQELAAIEAAHKLAVEKSKADWRYHKEELSNVVLGFSQSDDPQMLEQLQVAQAHLDAISRISTDMISSSSQYYQTYPSQSG